MRTNHFAVLLFVLHGGFCLSVKKHHKVKELKMFHELKKIRFGLKNWLEDVISQHWFEKYIPKHSPNSKDISKPNFETATTTITVG